MSIHLFRPGRALFWCFRLALAICAGSLCLPCPAGAQSGWEKMKLQFLQQACKGGDQNACQQLAKLKEKLGQKDQPAQPQHGTPQPGQSAPQQAEAAPATLGAPQQTEQPWTPPADDGAGGQPVKLDPANMPDVLGVRLGMTAQEALAAVRKTYPSDIYQGTPVNRWPGTEKPVYGYNVLSRGPGNPKDLVLSFTAPPEPQQVWKVERLTVHMHINRTTLLAALREKYGKETAAFATSMTVVAPNDAAIGQLVWLYDERGERLPLPAPTVFNLQSPSARDCIAGEGVGEPVMPFDGDWGKNLNEWCTHHLVALSVMVYPGDIVETTVTSMQDIPLAIRTSRAAAAWLRDVARKQHQDDLERSKDKKPVL